jgi:excisionase family DNA binding protein
MALTPLLTDRDVAAALAVQPETVRRWAACGVLPSVRLGNRLLRFRAEEVERWIEDHATGAHPTVSLRRRPGSIRSTR